MKTIWLMKKKNIVLSFLILLAMFFYACSGKDEIEIISSEDFFPQAKGNYDYDNNQDTLLTNKTSSLQLKILELFPDADFDTINPLKENRPLFIPDRMGYESKREEFFTIENKAYQFTEWSFVDSAKTINAFYNWLDCYGFMCASIHINQQVTLEHKEVIIWVSEDKIAYLSSIASLNLRNWQNLLYPEYEEEDWYFLLQQRRGVLLDWIISPNKDDQER